MSAQGDGCFKMSQQLCSCTPGMDVPLEQQELCPCSWHCLAMAPQALPEMDLPSAALPWIYG